MKKYLLLVPILALGVSAGSADEVSAKEVQITPISNEVIQQSISINSVYDNAEIIENGVYKNKSTSNSNPTHYYKFYYDGYSGNAPFLFHSDGNHKLNILNGNFIKVASENNTTAYNLTYGWNYIEVIQYAPGITSTQPYKLGIIWE